MSLILLPNLLNEESSHEQFLPPNIKDAILSLNGIIAESEKEARRYLKRFTPDFRNIPIRLLNEHTKPEEIEELLKPLMRQETWGLISDSGLPCIADPGHQLVARVHHLGLKLVAYPGPSSLFLALMLSGLSAQKFAFHGYLPQQDAELKMELKKLEQISEREKMTQMFIEAPYRNARLLDTLIATLKDKTTLCVACDLTMPSQIVISQQVSNWKKTTLPQINKKPTVFLFRL